MGSFVAMPHSQVRAEGVEPSRLAAPEFESGSSACSDMPASFFTLDAR